MLSYGLDRITDLSCRRQTLLIVRHGERSDDTQPSEDSNTSLTSHGADLARQLGPELLLPCRDPYVFSSPFLRCVQTAEALCDGATASSVEDGDAAPDGPRHPIALHRALWEVWEQAVKPRVVGEDRVLKIEEVTRSVEEEADKRVHNSNGATHSFQWYEPTTSVPDPAETRCASYDRYRKVLLTDLPDAHLNHDVLVVTHGDALNAILGHLTGEMAYQIDYLGYLTLTRTVRGRWGSSDEASCHTEDEMRLRTVEVETSPWEVVARSGVESLPCDPEDNPSQLIPHSLRETKKNIVVTLSDEQCKGAPTQDTDELHRWVRAIKKWGRTVSDSEEGPSKASGLRRTLLERALQLESNGFLPPPGRLDDKEPSPVHLSSSTAAEEMSQQLREQADTISLQQIRIGLLEETNERWRLELEAATSAHAVDKERAVQFEKIKAQAEITALRRNKAEQDKLYAAAMARPDLSAELATVTQERDGARLALEQANSETRAFQVMVDTYREQVLTMTSTLETMQKQAQGTESKGTRGVVVIPAQQAGARKGSSPSTGRRVPDVPQSTALISADEATCKGIETDPTVGWKHTVKDQFHALQINERNLTENLRHRNEALEKLKHEYAALLGENQMLRYELNRFRIGDGAVAPSSPSPQRPSPISLSDRNGHVREGLVTDAVVQSQRPQRRSANRSSAPSGPRAISPSRYMHYIPRLSELNGKLDAFKAKGPGPTTCTKKQRA